MPSSSGQAERLRDAKVPIAHFVVHRKLPLFTPPTARQLSADHAKPSGLAAPPMRLRWSDGEIEALFNRITMGGAA